MTPLSLIGFPWGPSCAAERIVAPLLLGRERGMWIAVRPPSEPPWCSLNQPWRFLISEPTGENLEGQEKTDFEDFSWWVLTTIHRGGESFLNFAVFSAAVFVHYSKARTCPCCVYLFANQIVFSSSAKALKPTSETRALKQYKQNVNLVTCCCVDSRRKETEAQEEVSFEVSRGHCLVVWGHLSFHHTWSK